MYQIDFVAFWLNGTVLLWQQIVLCAWCALCVSVVSNAQVCCRADFGTSFIVHVGTYALWLFIFHIARALIRCLACKLTLDRQHKHMTKDPLKSSIWGCCCGQAKYCAHDRAWNDLLGTIVPTRAVSDVFTPTQCNTLPCTFHSPTLHVFPTGCRDVAQCLWLLCARSKWLRLQCWHFQVSVGDSANVFMQVTYASNNKYYK